jgi:hypothetical protein
VAEAGDPAAPPMLLVHGWPQPSPPSGRDQPALPQHPSQLRGLGVHCDAQVDVEVVEGTHLLLDEQPELVAERAAAWFV